MRKLKARKLAYEFAIKKDKKVSSSWTANIAAGKDWLQGFRARNTDLCLRTPEPTSLARASFNKPAVNLFFNKLVNIYGRVDGRIPPQNILNLDETGISTVPTKT